MAFAREVITSVNEMKRLGLTPELISTGKIFPKVPFSRGKIARDFFNAAKEGDLEILQEMLKKDRFLVYEYDPTH